MMVASGLYLYTVVCDTRLLHNGRVYAKGDQIDLTLEQAAELGVYVEPWVESGDASPVHYVAPEYPPEHVSEDLGQPIATPSEVIEPAPEVAEYIAPEVEPEQLPAADQATEPDVTDSEATTDAASETMVAPEDKPAKPARKRTK